MQYYGESRRKWNIGSAHGLPEKFKGYCEYHNVEIEDDDPEFYRLYMRMGANILNT